MKIVSTEKAPVAIGPYSQAIEYQGIVYCSGQIGLNPSTGELLDGLENQTVQVMKNIDSVLHSAGSSKEKIIKATIFLANLNDYTRVNQLYEAWLGKHKPARSTIEVAGLPKGAQVEIEVIAVAE